VGGDGGGNSGTDDGSNGGNLDSGSGDKALTDLEARLNNLKR